MKPPRHFLIPTLLVLGIKIHNLEESLSAETFISLSAVSNKKRAEFNGRKRETYISLE